MRHFEQLGKQGGRGRAWIMTEDPPRRCATLVGPQAARFAGRRTESEKQQCIKSPSRGVESTSPRLWKIKWSAFMQALFGFCADSGRRPTAPNCRRFAKNRPAGEGSTTNGRLEQGRLEASWPANGSREAELFSGDKRQTAGTRRSIASQSASGPTAIPPQTPPNHNTNLRVGKISSTAVDRGCSATITPSSAARFRLQLRTKRRRGFSRWCLRRTARGWASSLI